MLLLDVMVEPAIEQRERMTLYQIRGHELTNLQPYSFQSTSVRIAPWLYERIVTFPRSATLDIFTRKTSPWVEEPPSDNLGNGQRL